MFLRLSANFGISIGSLITGAILFITGVILLITGIISAELVLRGVVDVVTIVNSPALHELVFICVSTDNTSADIDVITLTIKKVSITYLLTYLLIYIEIYY